MKIDTSTPIPDELNHPGRKGRYPFGKMKPGDSIVVECLEQKLTTSKAFAAARKWGQRNDAKFVARLEDGQFIRIWRKS